MRVAAEIAIHARSKADAEGVSDERHREGIGR